MSVESDVVEVEGSGENLDGVRRRVSKTGFAYLSFETMGKLEKYFKDQLVLIIFMNRTKQAHLKDYPAVKEAMMYSCKEPTCVIQASVWRVQIHLYRG